MDATKYPHIAVIGRIPGDDEDSTYLFDNMTETQARKAFEESIYGDLADDEKTPATVRKDWGVSCVINYILVSDSEIKDGIAR